ncbi:hypothetical protein ACFWVC_02305 [Streptomyces sp. NPDC058691]|uniref:hypothetical protein n=1 Tax=Streptomyces sp. NPDC058691 TaxID=3346601 RepID=UPI00365315FF
MSSYEQLAVLAALLDEAVAAQPEADRLVAACGEPGPVPAEVARDGSRQAALLQGIAQRLRELPVGREQVDVRDEAVRLLTYDHWMVRQALNLAFTGNADTRTEAARLSLNGLGAPADRLRALRERVRRAAEAAADRGTGPG